MNLNNSGALNLVLSGGGIKGLAFVGAYEELENKYKQFSNVAGVSAGALVGALIAAGYTSIELTKILNEFDFKGIKHKAGQLDISIADNILQMIKDNQIVNNSTIEALLYHQDYPELKLVERGINDFKGTRGNMLVNLIAFSKKNAFLNGDLLEKWVHQLLANKGVYTFGDLRTGIPDKVNPRGYRIRMTTVDANEGKVIVLPDDIAYYDIDPDKLSVAKAVRMSTCVPFVFSPVVLKKKENNKSVKHYMIDGGVLDNFPVWLIDSTQQSSIIGLKLEGKESKLVTTAENILKKLIVSSQDTGVPKNSYNIDNIAHINTGSISFLDFDINEDEEHYLYNQGKVAVQSLLASMEKRNKRRRSTGINRRINK